MNQNVCKSCEVIAWYEVNDSHSSDDDEAEVNRPRFSLPELRNILEERNSLKARVSDLEDELNVYKPHRKNQMWVQLQI